MDAWWISDHHRRVAAPLKRPGEGTPRQDGSMADGYDTRTIERRHQPRTQLCAAESACRECRAARSGANPVRPTGGVVRGSTQALRWAVSPTSAPDARGTNPKGVPSCFSLPKHFPAFWPRLSRQWHLAPVRRLRVARTMSCIMLTRRRVAQSRARHHRVAGRWVVE